MSQRNPMNERYTTDAKKGGNSRRSAASAKPKAKAAKGVRTVQEKNKAKTPKEKKANRRAERDRQYEQERKFGDPKTKKFKVLRILWFVLIGLSAASVALAFFANKIEWLPENSSLVFIIAAYVFIIAVLYVDLGQIRKERKKYVAYMSASKGKEIRAEEKRQRAAEREAKKQQEKEIDEKEAKKQAMISERADMSWSDKLKYFFKKKD